ncbi:hypothetical protein PENTCL1PPCAC_17232, partial [Pristionchus entomophagus]
KDPSSILELIEREYNESVSRRTTEELRLVKLFELKPNLRQTNLNFYYAMYPIIIRELKIFLRILVPEIDQLSEHLRSSILCCVIGKFIALKCYFRTSKKFKDYGKCMCTLLTCFDLEDCEEWVTEKECAMRKRDLICTLRSYATEYLTILHQTMRMGDFTLTEFCALIAIAFCDMGDFIPIDPSPPPTDVQMQPSI